MEPRTQEDGLGRSKKRDRRHTRRSGNLQECNQPGDPLTGAGRSNRLVGEEVIRKRSVDKILSRDELGLYVESFSETCRFVTDLRARKQSVAKFVQYPKISEVFSESVAARAIIDGYLLASAGPFASVARGGSIKGDIVATRSDGHLLRIETKASGKKDFATFGKKDYIADFLLWLRFGSLLQEGRLGKIEVLVCPRPADHLSWWAQHMAGGELKDRVTVAQFKVACKDQLDTVEVDLAALLIDSRAEPGAAELAPKAA
jgi:hypothetical protein